MDNQRLLVDGDKYLMKNYKRQPVIFTEGKGSYLIDSEGNEYLDFLAGIAVNSLGHSPEVVVEAIKKQADKLMHISNYFWTEGQITLGKILVENSFGDKVFFCNSGAEANEAAIKLARKYAYKKYGSYRNEIIAMKGSFHGRTIATLSITDSEKYREGYGPNPEGFKFANFNDIQSVKETITDNTCGIILEPIQGEGGVTAATQEFMTELKKLCEDRDILLIFDEIQCGIARTGRLFAYENFGIKPDIMSIAKALAGGFPIGAIIATEEVADVWLPGDHGTTFGGNPLACAAAVANMEFIIEDKLWERAEELGEYFKKALLDLGKKHKVIKQVKGKGLMLGLELEIEGGIIVEEAFKRRVIINATAGKVLRFVPALTIKKEEIDILIEVLDEIFLQI